MTITFLSEDYARHRNETSVIGAILRLLLGLFGWHLPAVISGGADEKWWTKKDTLADEEIPIADDRQELKTVACFSTHEEALPLCESLEGEGLRVIVLKDVDDGEAYEGHTVCVQVPLSDYLIADTIYDGLNAGEAETDLPELVRRGKDSFEIACRECGNMLSFPLRRRSAIEVCPKCGGYVDVPSI